MCKNFLLGFAIILIVINSSCGYFCRKFSKFTCSPISTRFYNITNCKIAPLSKQSNVFILQGEILKKITNVKISHRIYYKTTGYQNYHLILAYDNVDFCSVMKSAKETTRLLFDECKRIVPELCHSCPFQPAKMALNMTPGDSDCPVFKKFWNPVMDSDGFWPDGEYKNEILLQIGKKNVETFKVVYGLLRHTGNRKIF